MSLSDMAVLVLRVSNSLTAKSRTIEQVDWTTDAMLGSVGRLVLISLRVVPIYCAMDSPQGRLMLKGICLALDLIFIIDLDVLDSVWVLSFAFSETDDFVDFFVVDLLKIVEIKSV